MEIKINKNVFDKYEGFMVGVVLCKEINNKKPAKESFKLLQETATLTKSYFDPDSTHHLISNWKTIELEEKQPHHSSVEKLINDILKGKKVKDVNPFVNLCKYFTLKYVVPIGYDDLDYIKGGLTYTLASGHETFKSNSKKEQVKKGEIISKDHMNILSRGLDYKQSKFTQITKNTENALIHLEVIPPIEKEKLKEILKDIEDVIETFLNCKTKTFILDEDNPEKEIKD